MLTPVTAVRIVTHFDEQHQVIFPPRTVLKDDLRIYGERRKLFNRYWCFFDASLL